MTRERRKVLLTCWVIAAAISILGVVPASLLWGNGNLVVTVLAVGLLVTSLSSLLRVHQTEITLPEVPPSGGPDKDGVSPTRSGILHV